MPEEQVKNVVTPDPQPINLPRLENIDSAAVSYTHLTLPTSDLV